MKMFPDTGADPRHPALCEAAMAIGLLCAAHDPQQGLANLKAAYAAEKPGFRKRAVLAAMIAHLANWRSHALQAIMPGSAEIEAAPVTIVETGGVTPYLPIPEFQKKTAPKTEPVTVTGNKQ